MPWETKEELNRIVKKVILDINQQIEILKSHDVSCSEFKYSKSGDMKLESLLNYIDCSDSE